MKIVGLICFLLNSLSAQSPELMTIYQNLNSKFQQSDQSQKSMQLIAKNGLKEFEGFIVNSKNLAESDLQTWVQLYRGLEYFVFKHTETSDGFIDELVSKKAVTQSEKLASITSSMRMSEKAEREREARYAIGNTFPELPENTTDLNGNPIKISDYNSKVVLIDFWATWCGPCIKELPHVKKAFNKYKAKGFDILGISLDKESTEKLQSFVDRETMSWRHVSDGQGWNSVYARTYGIQSIPATFLLQDGKIVAKNLRGRDLENKLEELLGEK